MAMQQLTSEELLSIAQNQIYETQQKLYLELLEKIKLIN